MRSRIATLTVVFASCALAAGCGSSKSSTSTAKLQRAIPPTCGVDQFTPARIGPAPGRAGGWELTYQFPAKAPRGPLPGETTVVDLLEEPPVDHRPRLKDGQDVVVAGRQVSLVPAKGVRSYVSTWTTHAARYIIIANGNKPDTFERIIGCLP